MVFGIGSAYYYRRPDGENLTEKILASIKATSTVGIFVGAFDAIVKSAHLNSATEKWLIAIRPFGYMTGIAAVFATVTFMSTRMRGKDDALNHGIGALATTPLVKAFTKVPAILVADIMIVGTIGMMINKARRKQAYGLEEPIKFFFDGNRNRFPNFDYWEYLTGETTELEDYVN